MRDCTLLQETALLCNISAAVFNEVYRY